MASQTASIGIPFSATRQPPKLIRRKSPFTQALEWQDQLNRQRDNRKTKPHVLAMLARAWRDIEALKREIKLQPKGAKPIDAQVLPKRAGHRNAKPIAADAPQPPPMMLAAGTQPQQPATNPPTRPPPPKESL
jgi:hypothetical protein